MVSRLAGKSEQRHHERSAVLRERLNRVPAPCWRAASLNISATANMPVGREIESMVRWLAFNALRRGSLLSATEREQPAPACRKKWLCAKRPLVQLNALPCLHAWRWQVLKEVPEIGGLGLFEVPSQVWFAATG